MAPGEGARSQAADVPGAAKLSLRIVGRLALHVGAREVGALSRKSRALLGYLALTETGEETRERLVGLLWSEVAEGNARASLRQALHEIRDALTQAGFDGLTADKQALRLDRARFEVDLWDIFDCAAAGQPHPLLLQSDRPMERLLDELDAVDPAFRVWLLAKRQSLGDRLMRLIETAMRDGARPAADREGLARALRNLDPTHEEAARLLIRVRAEAGDIGGALGVYKALWDLLDLEYDVEPSRETQELIAAIKLGRPLTEPAVRPGPPAGAKPAATAIVRPEARRLEPAQARGWPKLMVSVAGFDGAATTPEHRYLVDGFRRELIACLIRFREWVVRDAALSAAAPASRGERRVYRRGQRLRDRQRCPAPRHHAAGLGDKHLPLERAAQRLRRQLVRGPAAGGASHHHGAQRAPLGGATGCGWPSSCRRSEGLRCVAAGASDVSELRSQELGAGRGSSSGR